MNYLLSPSSDITLGELLSKYSLDKSVTSKTVLDAKNEVGVTNWDLIKRRYSGDELDSNASKYPTGSVLVKQGTQLFLLNGYVNRFMYPDLNQRLKNNVVKLSTVKPFLSARLLELLQDPKYVQVSKSQSSTLTLDNNEVTVYIWSRAMSVPGSTAGGWLNVSGLVHAVHTEVNGHVGVFALSLPAINAKYQGGWQIDGLSESYQGASIEPDTLSNFSIVKPDPQSGLLTREPSFFANVLQQNDLVYIKMERLEIDAQAGFNPDAGDVVGQVWDFIGLIDTVGEITSPTSSTVNVRGRDMMKLLIDDGSYFFPEQFAQGLFTDENSLLTKRNKLQLEAQSVAGASYSFKTVDTVLKFLFNKFSNIGLIPNSVFSIYGEHAIKQKYQLKQSELTRIGDHGEIIDQLNASFLKEDRQGAWRICDLVMDPDGAGRVLADNSLSQDNGSLINSIHKFCQEPFVEFFGDTYKDRYTFVVRKQPFDAIGYRGLIYGGYATESKSDQVNGHGVVGKDDLLNDKIKRESTRRLSSVSSRPSFLSSLVIDIEGKDVLFEPQFNYHQEAYAWYRLIPRGLGTMDEISNFLLAPIVPLDEYAEVFGNQTLTMEYNYAPAEYLDDARTNDRARYIEAQTFYDLQFLIQCNQYLPFTRHGPITLTGDRTFKRGMCVYYEPTKEVFYVDRVVHDRIKGNTREENLRTTTLSLSRGMREPFIKGVNVQFASGVKKVSYFDIVNTKITNDASINNTAFLKNWRVDRDIFNFFLQRRQWAA